MDFARFEDYWFHPSTLVGCPGKDGHRFRRQAGDTLIYIKENDCTGKRGFPVQSLGRALRQSGGAGSDEGNVGFGTFAAHVGGPDAGLNFSDVGLAQIEHAKARLADTAADT